MDPVDDAFNTILSALHDLRQRVAALERAQPAPAETPQADEPPGAVDERGVACVEGAHRRHEHERTRGGAADSGRGRKGAGDFQTRRAG